MLSRNKITLEAEQSDLNDSFYKQGNNINDVRKLPVENSDSFPFYGADTGNHLHAPNGGAANTNDVAESPAPVHVPSVDYANGVQLDEVEDIVHFSEIRLGWNLWFYQYQEVTLLMKDGRGYTGLTQSLESFDALESRDASPHRWFQWRTNDSGVRERRNESTGEWVTVRGSSILDRQTQPRTIEADVSNTHYSGVWNMGGTARTSGYGFHASGTFELYISIMSQNWEDSNQSVTYIRKDARGSNLTANQTIPVGPGEVGVVHVDQQQYMDDSLHGTYRISGNTLVFSFADGTERTDFFAESGGGGLIIGNRHYV